MIVAYLVKVKNPILINLFQNGFLHLLLNRGRIEFFNQILFLTNIKQELVIHVKLWGRKSNFELNV